MNTLPQQIAYQNNLNQNVYHLYPDYPADNISMIVLGIIIIIIILMFIILYIKSK